MNEKAYIVVNSTVLYVLAFLTTTILHELSHALMGVFFQSDPILHHNYVEHFSTGNLTSLQQASIALAGPILSLIQGLFAALVYLKSSYRGLIRLFLLWLSVLGFNNFLGYLMTGPIFTVGDIGKVHVLLDIPVIVQIGIALIGAAVLLFIAYKLTSPFLHFSYKEEWVTDSNSKKGFSFRIIILPWLIGSGIITLLYLPVVALVSIIYPIMSGMVFIYPWQNAQRIDNIEVSDNHNIGRLSIVSIGLLIAIILVFKLILAPGIPL